MPDLDPDGGLVEVGVVRLYTPGVIGVVEVVPPPIGGTRAGSQVSEQVAEALRQAGLRDQLDVELTGVVPIGPVAGAGRGAGGGPAEIVAQVPHPGDGMGQVALMIREDGLLTWHSPESATPAGAPVNRGALMLTYRIPVDFPVDGGAPGGAGRGVLGGLAKRIVKVLAFALQPAAGALGKYLAGRWERENRWYGLTKATGAGLAGEPVDWSALTGGPTLLLVHGTFSRCSSGFADLAGTMPALLAKYGGRVLLFDHPTVSVDPLANAAWFAEQFVAGTADRPDASLELDIVCHSRGGLVARSISEQPPGLDLGGRQISVGSIVFVAAPNGGTVLADPAHLGALLDAYTNLLDFVPDVGAIDVLQMVFEVVKQLATGAAEGLPGLMAMDPAGAFLAAFNLNAGQRPGYAGVGSDYEPVGPGIRARAVDGLVDLLFRQANDLVVPRDGVWEPAGQRLVPTDRRLAISPDRGVSHCGYFALDDVRQALLAWLQPVEAPVPG